MLSVLSESLPFLGETALGTNVVLQQSGMSYDYFQRQGTCCGWCANQLPCSYPVIEVIGCSGPQLLANVLWTRSLHHIRSGSTPSTQVPWVHCGWCTFSFLFGKRGALFSIGLNLCAWIMWVSLE